MLLSSSCFCWLKVADVCGIYCCCDCCSWMSCYNPPDTRQPRDWTLSLHLQLTIHQTLALTQINIWNNILEIHLRMLTFQFSSMHWIIATIRHCSRASTKCRSPRHAGSMLSFPPQVPDSRDKRSSQDDFWLREPVLTLAEQTTTRRFLNAHHHVEVRT